MSARSELTTGGCAPYKGAGSRRASRLALAGVLTLLAAAAIVHGGLGGATAGGLAGALVCAAAAWEARVRQIGIRIEPQGILAVYPVGHLRFPLETVTGFSIRDGGAVLARQCVVIELLDGERRVVPCSGTLATLVGQLDDQLHRARLQAAAALSDGFSTAR